MYLKKKDRKYFVSLYANFNLFDNIWGDLE